MPEVIIAARNPASSAMALSVARPNLFSPLLERKLVKRSTLTWPRINWQ